MPGVHEQPHKNQQQKNSYLTDFFSIRDLGPALT
jgi:hypothetical protein